MSLLDTYLRLQYQRLIYAVSALCLIVGSFLLSVYFRRPHHNLRDDNGGKAVGATGITLFCISTLLFLINCLHKVYLNWIVKRRLSNLHINKPELDIFFSWLNEMIDQYPEVIRPQTRLNSNDLALLVIGFDYSEMGQPLSPDLTAGNLTLKQKVLHLAAQYKLFYTSALSQAHEDQQDHYIPSRSAG